MKIILILFTVFFVCSIAHPAIDEVELERFAWIDDMVTSLVDKICIFNCDDSPSFLDPYIPLQLRNKIVNAGKDVTKVLLKYALNT